MLHCRYLLDIYLYSTYILRKEFGYEIRSNICRGECSAFTLDLFPGPDFE